MALSARAAAIRGDDYQHVVGWYWACCMLNDPEIGSIGVEDPAGGAFDDVVVRRGSGRTSYFQVKTSNYAKRIIDENYLFASTPNGRSPLQRFHSTWRALRSTSDDNEYVLVTNRGFDPNHPLLGSLLDLYEEQIDVGRIPLKPRGALGRACKRWSTHLGIDLTELIDFLRELTLRHSGSERDWVDKTRSQMKLAGLRDDDEALAIGKDLVRTWVKTGATRQDRDSLKQQVAAKELLARTGTLTFQVHGMDRDSSFVTPNATLDIVDLYAGDTPRERRVLHHHSDWQEKVQPSLAAKVRELEAYRTRRVHVTGHMRLPLWFAIGFAMPETRRWVLSLEHATAEWSTASPASVTPRELCDITLGCGTDLAVGVALTHDPTADITNWARNTNSAIGRLIVLGPPGMPGQTAVPDGSWAAGWARAARDHLRAVSKEHDPYTDRIHLFLAAPAGVALMLGHQWNLLPTTTLYEYLPPRDYAETLTVR
ncbi:SAVED domain-containing protein [Saccharopolyspora sp. 7B]|uniref:SAVED domain-containing protein n=1 Tax=Saccharopolyspora sp. 7B TaxID=2877240 RepID=UPI001CD692DD|nr:SAVED domain-containing protein [Saccharopolyspora sp. 7B]MCA1278269.1 SAVED domain-containing protein [Saccharopolyspora sp. 7B]